MTMELRLITLVDGRTFWTKMWGSDNYEGFFSVTIFERDFGSDSFYFSSKAHINKDHILFIGEKEYKNVKAKSNN